MMVSAVAAEPSEVLLALPMDHLFAPAGREDSGRDILLRNLLDVTAREKPDPDAQNLPHNAEIPARQAVVLSVRAGRAERLRYVRYPVDRQQLADYLGADRSALSNELSKMQRDGLLSFRKNHFVLHRK